MMLITFHEVLLKVWLGAFLNLRLSETTVASASGDTSRNLHLTSYQVAVTNLVPQLLLSLTFFSFSSSLQKW